MTPLNDDYTPSYNVKRFYPINGFVNVVFDETKSGAYIEYHSNGRTIIPLSGPATIRTMIRVLQDILPHAEANQEGDTTRG